MFVFLRLLRGYIYTYVYCIFVCMYFYTFLWRVFLYFVWGRYILILGVFFVSIVLVDVFFEFIGLNDFKCFLFLLLVNEVWVI